MLTIEGPYAIWKVPILLKFMCDNFPIFHSTRHFKEALFNHSLPQQFACFSYYSSNNCRANSVAGSYGCLGIATLAVFFWICGPIEKRRSSKKPGDIRKHWKKYSWSNILSSLTSKWNSSFCCRSAYIRRIQNLVLYRVRRFCRRLSSSNLSKLFRRNNILLRFNAAIFFLYFPRFAGGKQRAIRANYFAAKKSASHEKNRKWKTGFMLL